MTKDVIKRAIERGAGVVIMTIWKRLPMKVMVLVA